MTRYEQTHQHTAHLHYDGKGSAGARIIIDAPEERPGEFEVMAMRPNGTALDCNTVYSIEDAEAAYKSMYRVFVAQPQPLKGKYAALRDHIRASLAIGRQAEREEAEDGGTCNFDSPAIHLPRWNKTLVEQAAKEAGSGVFSWDGYSGKCYVIRPDTRAQGSARTRNAEAMEKALSAFGYDTVMYYQMD